MNKKALIAMSGGVDSSVAAALMIQEGYECIGCTMKLFENKEEGEARPKSCCSLDDVNDARRVSHALGMPYYVFNYKKDFEEKIIRKFVQSYEHGVTPNPCIDCNRYMKFDKLYERAKLLGYDTIVTGHYARVEFINGKYVLKKSVDETKDQSYVLYDLTQEKLKHIQFPLGGLTKTRVREIAEEYGFLNANKKDSQDICFVPDGDYAKVMLQYGGNVLPKGDFIDTDGNIIGQHQGISHYTIGQRKGLGISFPEPRYVTHVDPKEHTITLGKNEDLFETTFQVKDVNWISGEVPSEAFDCKVKVRYRQKEQTAIVIPTSADTVLVQYFVKERAITPGQAAVFYMDDVILGGGVIEKIT